MKNIIKIGLILGAAFLAIAAIGYGQKYFYVMKYKMNTNTVDKLIANKEYKHYCLFNSYTIRSGGNIETATVDGNLINLQGQWGHRMVADEIYVVIFSNDLKTSEKLATVTRESAPHLFREGDPRESAHYCQEIQ